MKCKIRVAALALSVMLLCSLCIAAYAHEVPDEERKGTVTVKMEYAGKAVEGGTLAAYRVGQIQEDDGNYSFAKTPAMEDFGEAYGNLDDPDLAEACAEFVAGAKIPAYKTANNEEGKAVFSDLELGLYLIVQTEASDGYEPLKPFLISVPMNEDGHYVYEVTADGKFGLEQKPEPSEPTKPSDPTLPQTGQLNWPVPVLSVLGLGLFAIGWALCFGRKKDGHEK